MIAEFPSGNHLSFHLFLKSFRLLQRKRDLLLHTVKASLSIQVFVHLLRQLLVGSVRHLRRVPVVADIHFDYRLAIASIEAGADKIRINPGNIGSVDRVKAVVDKAKEHDIPIRVGVNSGSLQKDLVEKYGGVTAEGLSESALENLKIIEDLGYDDLVVSIKSSNVRMNYEAHLLRERSKLYILGSCYPGPDIEPADFNQYCQR